jgi:glucose-fructose oxidoreductase
LKLKKQPAAGRTRKRRSDSKAAVVRYAVIGLGHIAQAAMLPAFGHAKRNSRLAALVSGSPKKLKLLGRRYRIERLCSYGEADSLFRGGEIDAVYIALPNNLHREWAVRAAKAGLHVLCEKPMAMTARECEAMIRAAALARVKLMIAYRLHFEAANLFASQLSRGGQLGDLRFFSSDFFMQVRENNIRLKKVKGGGPLYDIGIYCINAARAMLGEEPRSVLATATRSRDRRFREVDENVAATMRFKEERLASFNCSFGAADRATYTVTGSHGSVTLDSAYEYVDAISSRVRIGEREQTRQFGKRDQFAAELEYFSQCILDNRTPEPSGAEGLADVRIIEAMHRSIRSGRWVEVKMSSRKRRPTAKQNIRRPPVPSEPDLVDVKAASQ